MPKTDLYRLSEDFEISVMQLLMGSTEFWNRIGKAIEPDAFSTDPIRTVAAAMYMMCSETGLAPKDRSLVSQRLYRWVDEGKINKEHVLDCEDYLDILGDVDAPEIDSVVNELLPVIKVRRNRDALHLGMKLVSQRADLDAVIDHLSSTAQLGSKTFLSGIDINPDTPNQIKQRSKANRLPTGISELDTLLGGGPKTGFLSMFVGDTGDGKSMALVHVAGTALVEGLNVLVATLELDDAMWSDRLVANLTGITVDSVEDGSMTQECSERLRNLSMGRCKVAQFSAHVTKVEDILAWADEVEKREGWRAQLLVVDYADLLAHSKARAYEGMLEVYGGLRDLWAVRRKAWVWTASQAQRKNNPNDKSRGNNVADSQHKVRISDAVVILNANEDATEIEYFVSKNRGGKRGGTVTLATELSCARMVPLVGYSGDEMW